MCFIWQDIHWKIFACVCSLVRKTNEIFLAGNVENFSMSAYSHLLTSHAYVWRNVPVLIGHIVEVVTHVYIHLTNVYIHLRIKHTHEIMTQNILINPNPQVIVTRLWSENKREKVYNTVLKECSVNMWTLRTLHWKVLDYLDKHDHLYWSSISVSFWEVMVKVKSHRISYQCF